MNRKDWRKALGISTILASGLLSGGCWDTQISIMPNPDPALRKSSAEYAADAVKRHPFKADLPSGGEAVANAQVGYALNRLEIVNLSDDIWNNVEIWINRKYVVFLPKMEPKVLKRLPFSLLYDGHGHYFQQDNKEMIDSVILIRGDKQFTVPLQLAD
jgi:hypothetical protein